VLVGAAVVLVGTSCGVAGPDRLIDLSHVRRGVFFAALGARACWPDPLLATLVFIQLEGQALLNRSAADPPALARFLIALPIGALISGFGAAPGRPVGRYRRTRDRRYRVPSHRRLPRACSAPGTRSVRSASPGSTPTSLAGLGLGLSIARCRRHAAGGPGHVARDRISCARRRRMLGMLLGLSGLAAWGCTGSTSSRRIYRRHCRSA
jgi:hypothetical protein